MTESKEKLRTFLLATYWKKFILYNRYSI